MHAITLTPHSQHDTTIFALLRTLDNANQVIHLNTTGMPKYAAAVAVELWQTLNTCYYAVKVCSTPNSSNANRTDQLSRRHLLLEPHQSVHGHVACICIRGTRMEYVGNWGKLGVQMSSYPPFLRCHEYTKSHHEHGVWLRA